VRNLRSRPVMTSGQSWASTKGSTSDKFMAVRGERGASSGARQCCSLTLVPFFGDWAGVEICNTQRAEAELNIARPHKMSMSVVEAPMPRPGGAFHGLAAWRLGCLAFFVAAALKPRAARSTAPSPSHHPQHQPSPNSCLTTSHERASSLSPAYCESPARRKQAHRVPAPTYRPRRASTNPRARRLLFFNPITPTRNRRIESLFSIADYVATTPI
jgi:hypothetical protein